MPDRFTPPLLLLLLVFFLLGAWGAEVAESPTSAGGNVSSDGDLSAKEDNPGGVAATVPSPDPYLPDVMVAYGFTTGCIGVIVVSATLVATCFAMSWAFKSSKRTRADTILHEDMSCMKAAQKWTGDAGELERFVDQGLERERYMRVDCLSLYFNRPWRHVKGPEVVLPKLCSNVEWLGGERFPAGGGGEGKQGVRNMTVAVWRFFWAKKTESARKCIFLEVVEGLCPAASSILMGLMVSKLKLVSGQVEHGHAHIFVILALLYGAIKLLEDRCHYYFEIEIPGASVRQELRQRLQYEFLHLQKDHAEAWPPGRCMAVLDRDVQNLVNNVWASIFALTKQVTKLVSLILSVFYQTRAAPAIQMTLGIMYVLLAIGIVNNVIARKPNLVDMAKRKRDWVFTMFAAATRQVQEIENGKLQLGTEDQDISEAATFFGKVSMVYRKRAFHFYFVNHMSGLVNKEMMTVGEALVMAILGTEVIYGRMHAGSVVGTFSAMNSLTVAFQNFNTTWLNLVDGYPSLLCIAQIFNHGAGFYDDCEICSDHDDYYDDKSNMDSESSDATNSLVGDTPLSPCGAY